MDPIEEICPEYVADERITMTRTTAGAIKAFAPFGVRADYAKCAATGGVVGPFEIFVRAPDPACCEQRFTETAPGTFDVTPKTAGKHLILVKEVFHNNFWGRLVVDVEGESLRSASRV